VALFALTYALIEANGYGWSSTRIIVAFVVAAVAMVGFVGLESRQRLPMLDLSLFRNRTFTGANTVMLFVALAMFGVFFYISLFMQQVIGFSPTQAGASFLPMTVLIILIAPLAGRASDRLGSRGLIGAGLVFVAVSLFLFSRLGVHSGFWSLLPAMLFGGVGMALAMTPTTAAAMSSVQADKAGVGSAVLNSMRQVGGSLGIAVMGAIVASGTSAGLAAGDDHAHAFVRGLHSGLEVAALIALAGSVIAVTTIRKVHHPEPAAAATFVEAA
jgi:predicted MFS family arabinose efflux permease